MDSAGIAPAPFGFQPIALLTELRVRWRLGLEGIEPVDAPIKSRPPCHWDTDPHGDSIRAAFTPSANSADVVVAIRPRTVAVEVGCELHLFALSSAKFRTIGVHK